MERFKFKISVLGDPNVGKTSLIHHFCEGYFRESYLATIGVQFLTKRIEISELNPRSRIDLQIWDIGGQSVFSRVRDKYIKGSQGTMFIWDVTNKNSLMHIDAWVDEVVRALNITNLANLPFIIIGNKIDLDYDNRIKKRAYQYLNSQFNLDIPITFTSAKTGEGMREAFIKISKLMISKVNE